MKARVFACMHALSFVVYFACLVAWTIHPAFADLHGCESVTRCSTMCSSSQHAHSTTVLIVQDRTVVLSRSCKQPTCACPQPPFFLHRRNRTPFRTELHSRACSIADGTWPVVQTVILTRVVDTMVHAPRPTRAEATDVANLCLDGTDGTLPPL